MRVTRAYEAQRDELMTQVRMEHEAILDAIVRRDPEAARSAARHHLEKVALRITSADRGFWLEAARAHPGAGPVSTTAGSGRGPQRRRPARRG
jgi:hypothetical protein